MREAVARRDPRRRRASAGADARRDGIGRRADQPAARSAPRSTTSLDEDTIVIGDGGDFVATAAYVLRITKIGQWLDPGPLGTLGVGPGYAMAAKLARPDSNVVIVYGDGAFGLHGLEFEAMVRQKIPVVGVIGNDAAWMQIRRGQVEIYGEERSVATALDFTHYEKVVEAVGGFGAYVERAQEIRPALERALGCGKPALVNVKMGVSEFRKGAISI